MESEKYILYANFGNTYTFVNSDYLLVRSQKAV